MIQSLLERRVGCHLIATRWITRPLAHRMLWWHEDRCDLIICWGHSESVSPSRSKRASADVNAPESFGHNRLAPTTSPIVVPVKTSRACLRARGECRTGILCSPARTRHTTRSRLISWHHGEPSGPGPSFTQATHCCQTTMTMTRERFIRSINRVRSAQPTSLTIVIRNRVVALFDTKQTQI